MPFTPPDVQLAAIAPEIVLCVAALVLLVLDGFTGNMWNRLHLPVLSTVAFGFAGWLAIDQWGAAETQLSGMVALDGFSIFVKVTLVVFGILTVWCARDHLTRAGIEEGEFYALTLFVAAGMMLMASAADLIVMFLALETFSIGLYVMVGFRQHSLNSQESALKYFLLGSFSSAFFLLGIAMVYGATGTTNLYGVTTPGASEGVAHFLATTPSSGLGLLVLATGFLIVGLGFKVAAVPFHSWTPDAYQGAPSPVTGFMAAGSKLAGFAAILRLFDAILFPLRGDWRPILIGIAVLTMIVGSVLAVVQEDLKRLLAYSSIAHAGFVLVGVIAASDRGVSGSLFYLATYGLTVLGAFAVVSVIEGRDEDRMRLSAYRGLFYERPALAGALTLFMLSLAGVPLTSGFIGKLLVFGAAIDQGYTWLAVIGVLASAIAAFFYLRVLVVMYMQEPDEDQALRANGGIPSNAVIAVTALATLGLGVVWGPLFDLARDATFFF
ncbi:MAG: NADH-quinone oxidoreductase subunit [Actinomycetota bacterium]|jgi:NADH-quinone oxidoreductase subunit N|nr:NADH-quinone oxidoreductase subunit [Actinomycetota bacterium]